MATKDCYQGRLHHVAETLNEIDHLGDWSPEKDCCLWLTFWQPVRKPSSESSDVSSETSDDLTLKMASTQVIETSVTNNGPSQDSNHPDDLFQSRYVTPGFKPFSYILQKAKLRGITQTLR